MIRDCAMRLYHGTFWDNFKGDSSSQILPLDGKKKQTKIGEALPPLPAPRRAPQQRTAALLRAQGAETGPWEPSRTSPPPAAVRLLLGQSQSMVPCPVVPLLTAAEQLWAHFWFHVHADMVVPRSYLDFVPFQQGFSCCSWGSRFLLDWFTYWRVFREPVGNYSLQLACGRVSSQTRRWVCLDL